MLREVLDEFRKIDSSAIDKYDDALIDLEHILVSCGIKFEYKKPGTYRRIFDVWLHRTITKLK